MLFVLRFVDYHCMLVARLCAFIECYSSLISKQSTKSFQSSTVQRHIFTCHSRIAHCVLRVGNFDHFAGASTIMHAVKSILTLVGQSISGRFQTRPHIVVSTEHPRRKSSPNTTDLHHAVDHVSHIGLCPKNQECSPDFACGARYYTMTMRLRTTRIYTLDRSAISIGAGVYTKYIVLLLILVVF